MNDFVGTSPWGKIRPEVARKRRGPIIAAVAYVGVKAHEVMPLRKGDFLICDASTRAIKQGVTSAKALKAFSAAGVQIYSHEGLHAKVIATDPFNDIAFIKVDGRTPWQQKTPNFHRGISEHSCWCQ